MHPHGEPLVPEPGKGKLVSRLLRALYCLVPSAHREGCLPTPRGLVRLNRCLDRHMLRSDSRAGALGIEAGVLRLARVRSRKSQLTARRHLLGFCTS
jgi:hypothetical protein